MLATTPIYHLEGAGNTQITLSDDHLRQLFNRIEADLHHGEVYQRALQHLQHAQHNLSPNILRAVGREAIRLALRQLVRQYRVTPPLVAQPCEDIKLEEQSLAPAAEQPYLEASVAPAVEVAPTLPEPQHPVSEPPKTRLPKRALSAKERVQQEQQEQRAALLRTIGEQLRQAREAKGYSLEQLHQLTWVPLYQLKFLEAGDTRRLPEDVYVQGFVRRIAERLNLDAAALLAPLNHHIGDRDRTVIPSWQRRQASLQPVHLYVGYAALMTGALGGLIWLSNEANETQALEADPAVQVQPTTTAPLTHTQQASAIANPEMAPPESGF